MPDEGLRQRFEAIVQGAGEPLVRRYLEEAHRCFAAEAYNGAVVMAWNAVAYYLRQVIGAIGVPLFEHNYTILHRQKPPADLWRINDDLYLQTCRRMGVLCDVIDRLDRCRNRRNDCAHPSGIFVSPDEALEDDDHPSRNRIGQLFVEWIEELAQSGRFSAADMELARRLRQHLPIPLSERLQVALQEMTRRYTE